MAKKKVITQVDANRVAVPTQSDPNIVPYLFNMDRVEKPNCILCQSEYREEVEDMYDEQKRKNYSAIKTKLSNDHNLDISRGALRNHLVRHHDKVNNNVALQEYAEEIQQWVNMQTNKAASIRARIGVLEREYFNIANQSDDIDLMERRKNADCLKKIAEVILAHESKLSEFAEEAKPVNILFNQLNIIVRDELATVQDMDTIKLVSKILERLKENCGNMLTSNK